jgi:hypothetical protein
MYVVTIRRMLSGRGPWNITFCCSSCDSETKAAIRPPKAMRMQSVAEAPCY